MVSKLEALSYHESGRPGKIEVRATKACHTQRDLSLAYTPGVAQPCLEIERDPANAYKYTSKGNLVAVVSNGTAVLGLGAIGALAGKPVMEGKGILFKKFADIDVFDIELNTTDPDEVIRAVEMLEPTFGGINLEDIKAPECFYIEETLKARLEIPVFHDDQHGTAIISAAALINAAELAGKDMKELRCVFSGAGAAGISCANLFERLGVLRENIMLVDSRGVIYEGRDESFTPYKARYAHRTHARSLADAMVEADVFVGLSKKGLVTQDMVKSMARDPIIFAMANPDPEITYPEAMEARRDVIMATGRSDYPNQVNNVLGFPFIFRGALDTHARAINEEMKLAAVHALAALAREEVPESVAKAYGVDHFSFGREYLIPKPFDHRVLVWEAAAVAQAAMSTGVARTTLDLDQYKESLAQRIGYGRRAMRSIKARAKAATKRLVFPEGWDVDILRAAHTVHMEGIGQPVVLGDEQTIHALAKQHEVNLEGIELVDPGLSGHLDRYANWYYERRARRGISREQAHRLMSNPTYYGLVMLALGDCDAVLSGMDSDYPTTIKPALEIIDLDPGVTRVVGLYTLLKDNKVLIFADTTMNVDPTPEELVEITAGAVRVAKRFDVEPRVALLSFSNFGSARTPESIKMARALELIRERMPDLVIDGEMQADTALNTAYRLKRFPFTSLKQDPNVLIFPDLNSGNICYKVTRALAGLDAMGPILVGFSKPVQVLHPGTEVSHIVDMAAIAAVEAHKTRWSSR
ncbi:MAG: NADP-dependent malic enzyme [Acidobacteria bacterium]|nr:NADP-dependent malic enzyme [Acidobacteriota bacterium]